MSKSLEALNDLKWHTVPTDISIGHQIKCEETIKKDLELLEILCNHLSAFLGTGENDSGTQKVILLRGNILENDKDFEKLKARLEFQKEYMQLEEWLNG